MLRLQHLVLAEHCPQLREVDEAPAAWSDLMAEVFVSCHSFYLLILTNLHDSKSTERTRSSKQMKTKKITLYAFRLACLCCYFHLMSISLPWGWRESELQRV